MEQLEKYHCYQVEHVLNCAKTKAMYMNHTLLEVSIHLIVYFINNSNYYYYYK